MCTYATVRESIDGSAKGPKGTWFHVSDATIYFDHPVHAMAEHTLNIDLTYPADGPSARVAVELTAESARRLIEAIETALSSAPAGLTTDGSSSPATPAVIGWRDGGEVTNEGQPRPPRMEHRAVSPTP